MIPKVIHYCWFGRNPLPSLAIKCIESWKKFLPDYEIVEWNEDNFDVNMIPYTKEAYEAKKYAFVSDYARFWILYHHGGIYFDTDVEVIKNMDDIIARGAFMGCEKITKRNKPLVAPGLGLGVSPKSVFYKDILDLYASLHFKNLDGSLNLKTVVLYISELLWEKGLKTVNDVELCAGIFVYSDEYFSPKCYKTGNIYITDKTVSIHHYDASWKSSNEKIKKYLSNILGDKLTLYIVNLKRKLKRITNF